MSLARYTADLLATAEQARLDTTKYLTKATECTDGQQAADWALAAKNTSAVACSLTQAVNNLTRGRGRQ